MKAIDYLQTADELIIAGADFKKGASDDQHTEDILITKKGEWKRSSLTGVGLFDYINAPNTKYVSDALHQKIKLQLATMFKFPFHKILPTDKQLLILDKVFI